MALTATLHFGNDGNYNKAYLITDVHCHFSRNYDNSMPTTAARCESVSFTLPAPDKTDLFLYNWYTTMEVLSGDIVFDLPTIENSESIVKKLTFKDAVCFSLGEVYDKLSVNRRLLNISFEADEIVFNEVEFPHL